MSAAISLSSSNRMLLVGALLTLKDHLTVQTVSNAVDILKARHGDIPEVPPVVVHKLATSYQAKTDLLLKRMAEAAPSESFACAPDEAPLVVTSLMMMAHLKQIAVPVAACHGAIDSTRIDSLFRALYPGVA